MKILITGGAGFIGNHLTKSLIPLGHEITVLDNLETSNIPNGEFQFCEGSILDEQLVSKLVKNVDQVVHLAASVGVNNIIESPLRGLKTNVLGSEIVIRACSNANKALLLTSSSEIYGKNTSNSLNELSDRVIGVPQKSRWSYSDSKAIEEAFALAYFRELDLPVKIVRLFNTVGPGQIGDYGMVMPRLIDSAIRNLDLEIYGTGQQTRCFMHVSDAVRGIISFMEKDSAVGEVVNLGNPQEISILKLAELVVSETNSRSKIKFISHHEIFGEDFEDMERRVPEISKAKELLDWLPIKNLQEIIRDILVDRTRK